MDLEGDVRDAGGALVHDIPPHTLTEKEGLALINGTDGMLGMLALALHDLANLLDTADVAAAMSVESLLGTDAVFAADLQGLRPHPGQAASAANIRAVLQGSGIMASHREAPYRAGAPALPETDRIADETIILPLFHVMTEAEQDSVVAALRAACG